jgi:hypothetical protein
MIGFGLNIGNRVMGGGVDAQAQAHYNRVIADGGVVPAGVSGTNAFFNAVKSIYGTTDITTAISVGVDAHYLGYKLGAGAGATSGRAVQKLYSCAGSSGDVVQTTAASQPLLLSHNGASSDNYWWGSGVTGNYCSTPNASANQITGDIDVKTTAKYIFNASYAIFVAKWGSAQSFRFYITPNDRLTVEIGGMTGATSTIAITSVMNHFRFTRNSSNGNILFYYSNEAITTDINSITWIQLGTTQVGGTGAFASSTNTVNIGQDEGNPFAGKIYRATISNSIGGTPVVDFNPATYNASTSQTQWTSTTGEVWTINTGSASTGYKGVLVDRTIVQSDGVDDAMQSSTITSRSNFTRYFVFNTIIASGTPVFIDGEVNDKHLIYKGASLLRLYNSGTGAGEITTSNTVGLKLITGDYNTSSSKLRTNAGADANGTVGNATSTKVTLFSAGSGGFNSNIIVTTVIDSNSISNNTQKTAMYNYIRSINNNAF